MNKKVIILVGLLGILVYFFTRKKTLVDETKPTAKENAKPTSESAEQFKPYSPELKQSTGTHEPRKETVIKGVGENTNPFIYEKKEPNFQPFTKIKTDEKGNEKSTFVGISID